MASMPSFTYKPGRFFSLKQQGAHCPFRRFFGKKIIHLHIFSVELHNKHITKMYMVQMFLQRMSTDQEDTSTRTKFSMVFHLLCHQSLVHDVEHTSYFRFFFSIIARSDFEEPSTKHFNIDFFSGKLTTDSENTSAYDT